MGTEKGLIFGSAPCKDWHFLQSLLTWPDVVIAADGGIHAARAAGFSPDIYVGDGDSGGAPEPGISCITLPAEKDWTDLEAAYVWARDHGVRDLILTGCSGGRLDHYLSALGLLETAAREGVHAVLLDEKNRAECLMPGTYTLLNHGYRYFSLVSLDRLLVSVTILGSKYELQGRDVTRGSSLTISNEFTGETAALSFKEGCCLLVESD